MLLTYNEVLKGTEININDIIERDGHYYLAQEDGIQQCGVSCPLTDEYGNCEGINCSIGLKFNFKKINEIEMLILMNKKS